MENWKKCLISKMTSIYEAVDNINQTGMQIALIVDGNEHLLGILTDGDIRRAVLKHIDVNLPVETIMIRNPVTVSEKQDIFQIRKLMRDQILHHIPVVDNNGKVCGLKSFSSLICPDRKANAVVIMAGGLGMRLRPMTEQCPKPMLRIGDKPILQTILENFIEYGFERFYLSVNYKADVIEKYFGDGTDFGVDIQYLREKERLGTAASLSLLPSKEKNPVLVMNGDILTKIDFGELVHYHLKEKAIATMAVREYVSKIPYGVIRYDGNRIVEIMEKPEKKYYVNAGIYVLNPEVIECIEKNKFCDMPMVFNRLIEKNEKTALYPVHEYWMDIGKMDDFEKAQSEYLNNFG